jgi:hypothetical protein
VLPIPELVPFRLTRQMRGVLQPHETRAVLRTPCVLGMTALRAGAGVLEVGAPLTTSHTRNAEVHKAQQRDTPLSTHDPCSMTAGALGSARAESLGLDHFYCITQVFCCLQGILGVFLREPLLDWQREGRLLKGASTGNSQAGDAAEDVHIAAKVGHCFATSWELKQ